MSKEELTNTNMELIAYVGSAKSCFIEAIDEALAGIFFVFQVVSNLWIYPTIHSSVSITNR